MNRENVLLTIAALIVAGVIAYQLVTLIELYIADCYPSTPTQKADNLHPGPADVSALIEEAKRITGESS